MTIDNVTTLQSTAGSVTNNFVHLLGYALPGDGGGGDFYWDATAPVSEANGGTVFSGGAATGVWRRIYNGTVFMEWFGADPTGTNDASAAIQRAINIFDKHGAGLVECNPTSNFAIQNSILVPFGISLNFNNITVKLLAGGELDTNYMFYLNATKAGATITGFSGNFPSSIGNVMFDNSGDNVASGKIFYSRSKHYIYNIRTDSIETLYNRSGGTGNDYNDQIHINRVAALHNQNIDTAIYINIGWLGDNLKIEDIELKGAKLNIQYCLGGVIDRILNANITINNCYGLTLSNGHIEIGNILVQNSVVKFSNIMQYYQGSTPLTITNDVSSFESMANKSCIIENYNINYYEGKTGLPSSYSSDVFDAYINGNAIINNFFRTNNYGTEYYQTYCATRVTKDGTTSFDEYNSCAANSISSVIVNGCITATNQSINTGIPTIFFTGNSGRIFQEVVATYYYKLILMLGDTRCLLATKTNIAELSFAVTASLHAPSINNPTFKTGSSFTLRIYRGTATGIYDYYVDIPFTSFDTIIDYGFYTNTGHFWKARTAGGVDTFNAAPSGSVLIQNADGTRRAKLAAVPTVGTWKVGDEIVKIVPDATNIGWICTAVPTTFMAITA